MCVGCALTIDSALAIFLLTTLYRLSCKYIWVTDYATFLTTYFTACATIIRLQILFVLAPPAIKKSFLTSSFTAIHNQTATEFPIILGAAFRCSCV